MLKEAMFIYSLKYRKNLKKEKDLLDLKDFIHSLKGVIKFMNIF